MGWASNHRGQLREALLALVVLALAFLNFGHASAVFVANGRIVITAHSVCGDPGSLPPAGDHFACHGCRPDVAALPPAPVSALRAEFCAQKVIYAAAVPATPLAPFTASATARGPPAA
jgi:hypothetical protein